MISRNIRKNFKKLGFQTYLNYKKSKNLDREIVDIALIFNLRPYLSKSIENWRRIWVFSKVEWCILLWKILFSKWNLKKTKMKFKNLAREIVDIDVFFHLRPYLSKANSEVGTKFSQNLIKNLHYLDLYGKMKILPSCFVLRISDLCISWISEKSEHSQFWYIWVHLFI